MIFHEKIIRFTILRKFPEIADVHNSGTEYARDMKFVSKYVVWDTLRYSTNNSILTKSGFRPFWKWALQIEHTSSMMCIAPAHHALTLDWGNFSLVTIPDPEWLVCYKLCVIDSSPQAKRSQLVWVICKRKISSDLNPKSLAKVWLCHYVPPTRLVKQAVSMVYQLKTRFPIRAPPDCRLRLPVSHVSYNQKIVYLQQFFCLMHILHVIYLLKVTHKWWYTAMYPWASFGGETGGHVPLTFLRVGDTISNVPPTFFEHVCVSPPKVLYPCKFWLERGLKLCIFSSPNTKFSYARGFCPLAIPKIL